MQLNPPTWILWPWMRQTRRIGRTRREGHLFERLAACYTHDPSIGAFLSWLNSGNPGAQARSNGSKSQCSRSLIPSAICPVHCTKHSEHGTCSQLMPLLSSQSESPCFVLDCLEKLLLPPAWVFPTRPVSGQSQLVSGEE
jgi:hypothetical protein